MIYNDEYFMKLALKEARKAFELGEIPIGAVIVCNNKVIAKAHNQTEMLKDSTAHAEIIAITAAENYLGSKYLEDCTLYVTVEPCVMCAGAIHWSHLKRIVYGTADIKKGYKKYSEDILKNTEVTGGILETEAENLIKAFFEKLREK
jgi:tRNA(adenine34) deaminase